MPYASTPQVLRLGELAPARGLLGPATLKAHEDEVTRGAKLMSLSSSYTPYNDRRVICVDDRLSGAAGLAGGALSLAFMHNYLFGGRFLSHALHRLRQLGVHLSLHEECGALEFAINGFVQRHLGNIHADGYKILGGLGYNVPMTIRRSIAAWARALPVNFVDINESMSAAKEVLGVAGPHRAGFVGVSLVKGHGFTAHDELKRDTGMLAFRFDPTVAFREASYITTTRVKANAAAYLALVFTAEVLLELTGPELIVGVYR